MSKVVNKGGLDITPLMTRPDRVAIVALGPSCQAFIRRSMSNEQLGKPYVEVWTLNRGFAGIQHDKLFVMDDLTWIRDHKNKAYAEWLQKHDRPIITSTAYPEWPTSVAYPLKEVVEFHEDDIFAINTVAYMVAYAIFIGVKEVAIFGADFMYPGGHSEVEEGGQAVAYMLGRCRQYGIVHTLPGESTLIYAHKVKQQSDGRLGREFYGYHRLTEMAAEREQEKARKKRQKETL